MCIFCKIINKEIPAEIVYQDKEVVAFKDINAQAPVHLLVIPTQHVDSLAALNEENYGVLAKIYKVIQQLARDFKIAESGYRVVVNNGQAAGQAVAHLHFHLLGGRQLNWPPG